ncbi:MAG: hypothetical protein CME62_00665 [Halobacteriovoraceae bacterium]|nr:hypothetical protein [Halobacteriovoraceae bacterium]|tara:strand:- start:25693 stop:29367 length:3675 start_codon:yes stop_codon:yes gene_type:complete
MSEKKGGEESLFWVGIGASAGGLESIQELCQNLPNNSNVVYIIAQHLSPKHKSMLPDLIQRNVDLKVMTIKDGIEPRPNTIYITPPQKDVQIEDGKIRLIHSNEEHIPKPSINQLFVSLANAKKEQAIGVILSGTGSDGAIGIKEIRGLGGITLAQDPESAKYDGMPCSAIDTECVDHILTPKEMGKLITRLGTELPESEKKDMGIEQNDSFADLMDFIQSKTGINFKHYKKGTLQRRIQRRMIAVGTQEFSDYASYVKKNDSEVYLLYKDILISVTNFFRDKKHFESLKTTIQEVVDSKKSQSHIRVWSVGCATGEEPYSIGILFAEAFGGVEKLAEKNLQIFATDVDQEALDVARRGLYNKATMLDVPEEYISKYFVKKGESYEVIKPLRDVVLFASHNVIDDPPFLRMNLIACRNLLIYFEQDLQKKIYNIFHYALQGKGYLFLGKSESTVQLNQLFRPSESKMKIYQKRSGVQNLLNHSFGRQYTGSRFQQKVKSRERDQENAVRAYESLVTHLGKASLVVDENLNIERVFGDATPFLKIADLKPMWNLGEIVNEAHQHEIKALAFKSLRTNTVVQGQPRKIKIDGKVTLNRVKIYPLQAEDSVEKFLLVVFETVEEKESISERKDGETSAQEIKALEDELAAAREHLQTVIEELETSNEELQSTNEELQSSNEELQSSNEELETTNEEMQSTNEELLTVNEELNTKTNELERTSNELTNIKNSLEFPLVVLNHKDEIIRANKKAEKFFNESIKGKIFENVLPKQLRKFDILDKIEKVKQEGISEKLQLEMDKSYYWLHITPFRTMKHTVKGVILSFINNTDFMMQQKLLDSSRKKAQAANVAKADFLANMSHEIRTPLNAICCIPEMLETSFDDPAMREELISILKNSSNNLKELVDDILDFSKLEAGQVKLEHATFNLRDLVTELLNTYSVQASEKNISLSTQITKKTPEYFIGDSLRLKQVISNLISNAIKFTEDGEVFINVFGEHDEDDHKNFKLVFQIEDTGIGMTKEELQLVFEKFSQAHGSISANFGGTGLGLSIVKELVELMSGFIDIQSEKGEGTTFILKIPLQIASKKGIEQLDKKKKLNKIFDDEKEAEKKPVLVVEDNDANLFVITTYLKKLGCHYQVAKSGKEGLSKVKKQDFPLVLLDIQMNEMDGFEVFENLKKIDEAKRPKVIAVTAHVHESIRQKTKEVGMNDFLAKPIELSKLHSLLEKYLQ